MNSAPLMVAALVGIAQLQARQGRLTYALELYHLEINHPSCSADAHSAADDAFFAQLQATLSPEITERAIAKGKSRDLVDTGPGNFAAGLSELKLTLRYRPSLSSRGASIIRRVTCADKTTEVRTSP